MNDKLIVNDFKEKASLKLGERSMEIDEEVNGTKVNEEKGLLGENNNKSSIVTLITEGGGSFFRYLKELGLSREPNLLVLSSKHYFYYDETDLKSVKVLINLKKLNLIKHLDLFLNSLCRILPKNTRFIGYFSSNKAFNMNGFGWVNRSLNKLKDILHNKKEYFLDENEVSLLLTENGFQVVDMKMMKGSIYFCSQSNLH